jgi:hypothetical protein
MTRRVGVTRGEVLTYVVGIPVVIALVVILELVAPL